MKTYVECKNCGSRTERTEELFTFQVPVKGFKDLDSSVQHELIPEEFEDYYCESCNSRQNAAKGSMWGDLPPTMLVVLRRWEFDFDTMGVVKLFDYFEFPQCWDVTKYSHPDKPNDTKEPIIYQLAGVVVHSGTASGTLLSEFIEQIMNCL
jgi:ubiquitin C-terminal hydrolase